MNKQQILISSTAYLVWAWFISSISAWWIWEWWLRLKMTWILSPLLDFGCCVSRAGRRLNSAWAGLLLSLQNCCKVTRGDVHRPTLHCGDTHGHKKVGSGPLHHPLGFSVMATSTLHSPIDGVTSRHKRYTHSVQLNKNETFFSIDHFTFDENCKWTVW